MSKKLMLGKGLRDILKNATLTKMNVRKEPILSSVIYGIQLSMYLSIKKKARILIPDSATMIGVVDSEGILEENEVFI